MDMFARSSNHLNIGFGATRRRVRHDVLFASPAAVFTTLLAAATSEYAWRGSRGPHSLNLVVEGLARA